MHFTTAAALLLASHALAYELPHELRKLYDEKKSAGCKNILADGYTNGVDTDKVFYYCGDLKHSIYLHSDANGSQYDNLLVSCNGVPSHGHHGGCHVDPKNVTYTDFKDQVKQFGIKDLDPNVHPYVVFGNKKPRFNPEDYGMQALSVMAVVCNDQLIYGIWGDVNTGDATGSGSLALAKACFPDEHITPEHGHLKNDVLYLGFEGDYVPYDADWKAKDTKAFEESIKAEGDKLVHALLAKLKSKGKYPSFDHKHISQDTRPLF